MHDYVGQDTLALTVPVALARACPHKLVQVLHIITMSVVLDIHVVVDKVLAKIHREPRRDATFAHVYGKEMVIRVSYAGYGLIQAVRYLVGSHSCSR